MKLLTSKKGGLKPGVINLAVIGIVFLVILLTIYAVLVPEAQSAGNSMNASNLCQSAGCFHNATGVNASINDPTCLATEGDMGVSCATRVNPIPLASLFSGGGVVFVIVMAALIILIVKAYLNFKN